jgi:hypothetical protein
MRVVKMSQREPKALVFLHAKQFQYFLDFFSINFSFRADI